MIRARPLPAPPAGPRATDTVLASRGRTSLLHTTAEAAERARLLGSPAFALVLVDPDDPDVADWEGTCLPARQVCYSVEVRWQDNGGFGAADVRHYHYRPGYYNCDGVGGECVWKPGEYWSIDRETWTHLSITIVSGAWDAATDMRPATITLAQGESGSSSTVLMDQTFYAWNYDPYAFRTTLGAKVGIYRGYNRSACDRPGESRVVRWEPGGYSVERGSSEDRIPPDEKDTGGWPEVEADYSVPEDPPPRWDLPELERGLWTDQSIYFDNIYFNYH